MLTDEQVSHCPVLILGNKIDKATALSEDQLKQVLNCYALCTGKVLPPSFPFALLPARPRRAAPTLTLRLCCVAGSVVQVGVVFSSHGSVHVQRAEEAGLRGRIPLAGQLPRLTHCRPHSTARFRDATRRLPALFVPRFLYLFLRSLQGILFRRWKGN